MGVMLRGPCSTIKVNRVVSQRGALKGIPRLPYKRVVFAVFVCLLVCFVGGGNGGSFFQ